ncbi:Uncharacterized protein dnm_072040 [Desulfonema magnum]|uniref:Uncharacterized protein n=1 Tax=Desulfonema magnum TaxID=45655 RepID=A0A975GRL6_9BACT|nr:Uncharacterized protein dnm_072040 [Desulfonema magnum]
MQKRCFASCDLSGACVLYGQQIEKFSGCHRADATDMGETRGFPAGALSGKKAEFLCSPAHHPKIFQSADVVSAEFFFNK